MDTTVIRQTNHEGSMFCFILNSSPCEMQYS
jgi:hypothetical protein